MDYPHTTPEAVVRCAGCPSHETSHFQRLGGKPAVTRLVDAFYQAMDQLPDAKQIRQLHPQQQSTVKATLTAFLCEWMRETAQYSSTHGAPRLRTRHLPFRIGDSEGDAWLACMAVALDQVCSDDLLLKLSLMEAFHRTAHHLRNQEGLQQHPGSEIFSTREQHHHEHFD